MGHILLQTTAGALSGLLSRSQHAGGRAYVRSALASSARIAEGEVDAIAAGHELADWCVVRDMARGVGLSDYDLAFRALAEMDGTEEVDHDDNPDTPKVIGYRYAMSTADEDRARDVIEQAWNLKEFRTNPVAPWAHDYGQPAVGVWRNVDVHQGPSGAQLRGTFIPLALPSYPLSVTVAEQMKAGVLRTVSVGLYPRAVLSRGSLAEDDPNYSNRGGYYIMGPTLLECSPTPMPMNQNALRIRAAEAPAEAPAEAVAKAAEAAAEEHEQNECPPLLWARSVSKDDSNDSPGLPWVR